MLGRVKKGGSDAAAKSGTFDPPSAPWRSEGVGTKGVPKPRPSGGVDLASGGSNKGHDKEERLSGDARVRLDGFACATTNLGWIVRSKAFAYCASD